jgi:hypothetical protein
MLTMLLHPHPRSPAPASALAPSGLKSRSSVPPALHKFIGLINLIVRNASEQLVREGLALSLCRSGGTGGSVSVEERRSCLRTQVGRERGQVVLDCRKAVWYVHASERAVCTASSLPETCVRMPRHSATSAAGTSQSRHRA